MNRELQPPISRSIPMLAAMVLSTAVVFAGPTHQHPEFDSVREVLDYLHVAEVVSATELSTGVTRPKKLRLERDGFEVSAVFHDVSRQEIKPKRLANGHLVMYLRDSFRNQVAAYELSRLLEMESVPPTVLRKVGGRAGSAQLWIEGAMTEEDRLKRGLAPPDGVRWSQQMAERRVFDNLINNIDRNQGNLLIDADWKLWLIDHTRAFGRDRSLPYEDRLNRISRQLWSRVKDLDAEVLRDRLRPYLGEAEIRALLHRRTLLVQFFEERIARLGESAVLFTDS